MQGGSTATTFFGCVIAQLDGAADWPVGPTTMSHVGSLISTGPHARFGRYSNTIPTRSCAGNFEGNWHTPGDHRHPLMKVSLPVCLAFELFCFYQASV